MTKTADQEWQPSCLYCGSKAIWGGDHTMEDYCIDDKEGMVSNWGCSNEDCAVDVILVYVVDEYKNNEETNDENKS